MSRSMKRVLSAVFAVMLFLSAFPAFAETAAEKYNAAKEMLAAGDYAGAAAAFDGIGAYEDAGLYAIYAAGLAYAGNGDYMSAVMKLELIPGFHDSDLLTVYYSGLFYESLEMYEEAGDEYIKILYYRDVNEREAALQDKINDRDYRSADAMEKRGELEKAYSMFISLRDYKDSKARAAAVMEKINQKAYDAADALEKQDKLQEAYNAFIALKDFKDSKDRAAAILTEMALRKTEAAYQAALKLEAARNWTAAYDAFIALGDYKDSNDRAAAIWNEATYMRGRQAIDAGKYTDAAGYFTSLGDYRDSERLAYMFGISSYCSISHLQDNFYTYKFHDVYGLINLNDNSMTAPYWDSIGKFNEYGLAKVTLNGRTGLINTKGETVLKPTYSTIYAFNEYGAAKVRDGDKYRLIDTTGNMITKEAYDGISDFNDGLCTAVKWSTDKHNAVYVFLLQADGKVLTDPKLYIRIGNTYYDSDRKRLEIAAPVFENDVIVARTAAYVTVLDRQGQSLTDAKWTEIGEFHDGLAYAVSGGKYGYIGTDWKTVIAPEYSYASDFSDGLAAFKKTKDGLFGYIDTQNNVVIEPKYEKVTLFSNGYAEVFVPEYGWQVIDRDENVYYFIEIDHKSEYEWGIALMEAGEYEQAIESFTEAEGYKDSAEKIEECELLNKDRTYENALSLMNEGRYDEAIALFGELEGHKDSVEKIEECESLIKDIAYENAVSVMNEGRYEEAISLFGELGDYKDSAERITQCLDLMMEETYINANRLLSEGKTEEAYKCFMSIRRYHDVEAIIESDPGLLKLEREWKKKWFESIQVGYHITFGRYEQDNITENGQENIEWIVLDMDKENGHILLMSLYGLDCRKYNEDKGSITWRNSSLRAWLNDEFLNTAFSADEQCAVVPVHSSVNGFTSTDFDKNQGELDLVSLLSKEEAEKYLITKEESQCVPTPYAVSKGVSANPNYKVNRKSCGCWWLNSCGLDSEKKAVFMSAGGEVYLNGILVTQNSYAVRPVIMISLDKVVADGIQVTEISSATPTPKPTATPKPKQYATITKACNVRKGAGSGYDKLGSVSVNERYEYLGSVTQNGSTWYKIKYKNQTGFIHSDYARIGN